LTVSEIPQSEVVAVQPAGQAPEGDALRPGTERLLWIAGAVLLAAVAATYTDTLRQLVEIWNKDPSYSHGFLVPLASLGFAVLAWQRDRPTFADARTSAGLALGIVEIVLGIGLHAVGWVMTALLLDVVALVFIVRGLLLVLGGPRINRTFGFAALFLIFMAPLPPPVYQFLALTMQQFVSVVSTFLLEMLGIAVFRQGYMVHLSDYSMEVGEACSGVRGITAILALGVAMGELMNSSRPVRWLLGLLAIPVAIGSNCLRVTLTGIIMVFFGRQWAEGVFHTLEGLAVLLVAAGVLALIALGLARVEKKMGWGREG
jgi:exosortase